MCKLGAALYLRFKYNVGGESWHAPHQLVPYRTADGLTVRAGRWTTPQSSLAATSGSRRAAPLGETAGWQHWTLVNDSRQMAQCRLRMFKVLAGLNTSTGNPQAREVPATTTPLAQSCNARLR